MISSPASESLEHARFAVVDVETTGVRAQVGGRILEVAVAILEGGTIHLAFEALLDPATPRPAASPSARSASPAAWFPSFGTADSTMWRHSSASRTRHAIAPLGMPSPPLTSR